MLWQGIAVFSKLAFLKGYGFKSEGLLLVEFFLFGCMAEGSLIYIKTKFYPRLKTRKGMDSPFHSTFLVF